jgi:hypothetical protein
LRRYRQRFVIVVDHVKTRAEVQLALTVAKSLLPVAQIIVTSRLDIEDIEDKQEVQLLRLGGLDEAEAKELLHWEAKLRGMTRKEDESAQPLTDFFTRV